MSHLFPALHTSETSLSKSERQKFFKGALSCKNQIFYPVAYLGVNPADVVAFSSTTGLGRETLWSTILSHARSYQRRTEPISDGAASDGSESVIYLARPCQYVDLTREKYCSRKYWSSHRFAEEVVSAYEQALDQIKNLVGGVAFHLVGYSGGGAVAVLIAARRGDVISVRTVAGYLDHIALNEKVGVAPLRGSLDPMRVASALRGVPQVHYSGSRDLVIPPWVGEKFVLVVGNPKCARSITVDGVSHEYGWVEYWKTVEHIKPTC